MYRALRGLELFDTAVHTAVLSSCDSRATNVLSYLLNYWNIKLHRTWHKSTKIQLCHRLSFFLSFFRSFCPRDTSYQWESIYIIKSEIMNGKTNRKCCMFDNVISSANKWPFRFAISSLYVVFVVGKLDTQYTGALICFCSGANCRPNGTFFLKSTCELYTSSDIRWGQCHLIGVSSVSLLSTFRHRLCILPRSFSQLRCVMLFDLYSNPHEVIYSNRVHCICTPAWSYRYLKRVYKSNNNLKT